MCLSSASHRESQFDHASLAIAGSKVFARGGRGGSMVLSISFAVV